MDLHHLHLNNVLIRINHIFCRNMSQSRRVCALLQNLQKGATQRGSMHLSLSLKTRVCGKIHPSGHKSHWPQVRLQNLTLSKDKDSVSVLKGT